jgi:hypothetical protein
MVNKDYGRLRTFLDEPLTLPLSPLGRRRGEGAIFGPALLEGGRKMIRISKRAVEKLRETYQNQKNLYRVFVSGMG